MVATMEATDYDGYNPDEGTELVGDTTAADFSTERELALA